MIEIEVKSLVDDLERVKRTLERGGARLVFEGELEDRRYDAPGFTLRVRDHVLRLRTYRGNRSSASLDWKGPTSSALDYKQREELTVGVDDAESLGAILERLGYEVTMAIDRHVWQYEIAGAMVRLERYPRMDDLVEVEGSVESIERAIEQTGLPRAGFTSERLPDFVRRFEERTGARAALSSAELAGGPRQDPANA
jgi:predicted adenylyl cyclase CyaB